MAVQLLRSAGALYLALSENPLTEFGYSATRLPLVRCVVVFGGKSPWYGPVSTLDLMLTGDGEAPPDVPRMECLTIDLRHSPDPGKEANVAFMLVRLQAFDNPDSLSAAAEPSGHGSRKNGMPRCIRHWRHGSRTCWSPAWEWTMP